MANSRSRITIAVDAMGGDGAPVAEVAGAVQAARELPIDIILSGESAALEQELSRHGPVPESVTVRHASQTITMSDNAARSVRAKSDSSVSVSARLVANGDADAMLSAGNTGAVMAAALLTLGRLPGISRPAIGVLLPATKRPVFLLDAGANSDIKPEHLVEFAVMGTAYMKRVMAVDRPSVGILSIGEEQSKGNYLVQATHRLLEDSPLNLFGNVEGRDIPRGETDVVICDGFVGNVALKLMEGMAEFFLSRIKQELTADFRSRLGALLLRPRLQAMRRDLDPDQYGGAHLLGVKGVCVIAHGSTSPYGMSQAIRFAYRAVERGVLGEIEHELSEISQQLKGASRS